MLCIPHTGREVAPQVGRRHLRTREPRASRPHPRLRGARVRGCLAHRETPAAERHRRHGPAARADRPSRAGERSATRALTWRRGALVIRCFGQATILMDRF